MLDYTQILRNAEMPNYVAPVSLTELGARQFSRGMPISNTWPAAMLEGYRKAERAAADAETMAYLVAQGWPLDPDELDELSERDPNYQRYIASGEYVMFQEQPPRTWGMAANQRDGYVGE